MRKINASIASVTSASVSASTITRTKASVPDERTRTRPLPLRLASIFARSGDGLLTALQMLTLLKTSGKKASTLFNSFSPNPQRLENLRGIDPAILQDKKLQSDLATIEANLNGKGRVLVRPSGTEALVRVMVEAETDALLTEAMDALILRITAEA